MTTFLKKSFLFSLVGVLIVGTLFYASMLLPNSVSADGQAQVNIYDDYFAPQTLTVPAGTTVFWTNKGLHAHTLVSADGLFRSSDLLREYTFSYTFSVPGTYRYYDRFYGNVNGSGMWSTVIVTQPVPPPTPTAYSDRPTYYPPSGPYPTAINVSPAVSTPYTPPAQTGSPLTVNVPVYTPVYYNYYPVYYYPEGQSHSNAWAGNYSYSEVIPITTSYYPQSYYYYAPAYHRGGYESISRNYYGHYSNYPSNYYDGYSRWY